MKCPKCNQAVETGAAFCGNCGQALRATVTPIAEVMRNQSASPSYPQPLDRPLAAAGAAGMSASVPNYALAIAGRHIDENKALLALLFGLAGIAGSLFLALIGLVLGVAGLVMGTMSRSGTRRGLSTVGLVASSLAILSSLAVWVYAVKHDPPLQKPLPSAHSLTDPAVSASSLTTPCYAAGFVDTLNVTNQAGSCDMSAFNGPTIDSSTNAYKVYANQSTTTNARNFTGLVKLTIEKDIKDNLPGFNVDTEQVAQFAGSPAYVVNSSDKETGIAIVEAAVLHQTSNGDNIFILVHAVNGKTSDLSTIEAQWQWK